MIKEITIKELKECINDNKIPDDYIVKHNNDEIIIEAPDGRESYHLYEDDD